MRERAGDASSVDAGGQEGPESDGEGGRAGRRAVGLVAVVTLLASCSLAGPPERPPPVETPAFRPDGGELTELEDDEHPLSPPPFTETERADPILGSTLAEHPELQRRVNYWILRWQTWGRDYFTRYLERMVWYGDLVDREIAERDLPESLRYLPIVESGYNPTAVSRVGAAGMWQFMPGTARFLGLDVGPLIDERRDPWRSTGVALDYLVELRERFDGSWFLALAAYNAGWGRVQRVVERYGDGAGPSDSLFWAIRDRLPAETRDFVPKLLAAARLARDPVTYGFEPAGDAEPMRTAEVRVPDATSLDVVAELAGVPFEEIERLNPHLRRGYTPPDRETALRVPEGTEERFRTRFAGLPPERRVSFIEHRIGRGETLTHLAGRYGVPLRELRAANPEVNPRRLQIGQWVVVPRSPRGGVDDAGVRTATAPASSDASAGTAVASRGPATGSDAATTEEEGEDIVHRVARGESLWLIARRYGVGVADLRRWNDLEPDAVLRPGDSLEVRGASTAVHRVRRGDTLTGIAVRYGVPTEALLRANGLTRSSVIRPGDEVRIPGDAGS